MIWIDVITVLAVGQFFTFCMLVGFARGRYGVKAPATTGNEVFERYYRVQMNTLELLVVFIPVFWLAARYWRPHWIALLGVIYLVGRVVYYRAYIKDPSTRTVGYLISAAPVFVLMLAALVGAFMTEYLTA